MGPRGFEPRFKRPKRLVIDQATLRPRKDQLINLLLANVILGKLTDFFKRFAVFDTAS